MSAGGYQRLEFSLPAGAEARLVGELWGAGTLGLECREAVGGRLEIVAYFARRGSAAGCAERVTRNCPEVELRSHVGLPDADWLEVYRRRARPFALGRRFRVDPGEPEAGRGEPPADGRVLMRLPARRAFGTGEHATTRLVVEWLDELELTGRSVLDVGCGSGILSFVALLSGAGRVTAVEIDPVAALIARGFQDLNGIRFPLIAGRVTCLRPVPVFDLLLANVLPEALRPDLAALAPLLRPGGRALFSGLLEADRPSIETRLSGHGFEPVERRHLDGWSAVLTTSGRAGEAISW